MQLTSLLPIFKKYCDFLASFDTNYNTDDEIVTSLAQSNLRQETNKVERGLDLILQLLSEDKVFTEDKRMTVLVRRQKLFIGLNMHKILIQIVDKIVEKMAEALEFAGTNLMRSPTTPAPCPSTSFTAAASFSAKASTQSDGKTELKENVFMR